ncbi:signal transducer and activator of transcription C-like [Thrips palmi]|uniref:Signal transducer and activator of transcription C-like n=1 Tax=Thrips palmi TaxID=161013 RepID=A0A6P8ZSL7_THRPL|nr:signal transducer and activator of transcription C-like [Thrips palmi]
MREGLDVWRCRQQQLLAKKAHEQKQLREMLLTYSPWGRPGGGAPNPDTIRKRKALQLETLYGTSPPLPSQPRHAVNGSETRRLRCDPQLLFQFQEADRRAVDNLLRYRTDPRQQEQYRRDLDRMVQEKRLRQQQQQQRQQQQHQKSLHHQHQHDRGAAQQQDGQDSQDGHRHQERDDTDAHQGHVRRRRSAGAPSADTAPKSTRSSYVSNS